MHTLMSSSAREPEDKGSHTTLRPARAQGDPQTGRTASSGAHDLPRKGEGHLPFAVEAEVELVDVLAFL